MANESGILSGGYKTIAVIDLSSGEEIAAITDDSVTTASNNIVVKLTPKD